MIISLICMEVHILCQSLSIQLQGTSLSFTVSESWWGIKYFSMLVLPSGIYFAMLLLYYPPP